MWSSKCEILFFAHVQSLLNLHNNKCDYITCIFIHPPGFTISLTVVLAASASAVTFPPSYIEARLVIAVAVATTSIATSAMALFLMTSLRLDLELGVAVVTSAAVSVAFASAWAVGAMVSNEQF